MALRGPELIKEGKDGCMVGEEGISRHWEGYRQKPNEEERGQGSQSIPIFRDSEV